MGFASQKDHCSYMEGQLRRDQQGAAALCPGESPAKGLLHQVEGDP